MPLSMISWFTHYKLHTCTTMLSDFWEDLSIYFEYCMPSRIKSGPAKFTQACHYFPIRIQVQRTYMWHVTLTAYYHKNWLKMPAITGSTSNPRWITRCLIIWEDLSYLLNSWGFYPQYTFSELEWISINLFMSCTVFTPDISKVRHISLEF